MRRPCWPTVFFNPGWIGLSHPYVPYKVVGHRLYRQPGAVGGEAAGRQVVQPHAVLEVAYRVLDLGVAAVVSLQFEHLPVPVGDEAVIAVVGEEGQQRVIAPGAGVAVVAAALLGQSVGLADGGVQVNGQGPVAGSGPGCPDPGQQLAAHPVQLADMAPPEAAQEGAQSLPSRKRGVEGALAVKPSTRAVPPARSTAAASMQSPPARTVKGGGIVDHCGGRKVYHLA